MDETYAGKPSIAQIHSECVKHEKPSLRITQSKPRLIPLEDSTFMHAGFAFQNPLMRDISRCLVEKYGFLRVIREKDQNEKANCSGNSAQEEEQQLPAGNSMNLNIADPIGNHSADKIRNAVPEEPSRLPNVLLAELLWPIRLPGLHLPGWLFFSLVKHTDNKGEARGDTGFSNTKEEAGSHEPSKILGRSMAH
jgi:hypothetical protein